MFRILHRKVEVVVVLVTGGAHVAVVVHVQPQGHQLLDQASLPQGRGAMLRPWLGLQRPITCVTWLYKYVFDYNAKANQIYS